MNICTYIHTHCMGHANIHKVKHTYVCMHVRIHMYIKSHMKSTHAETKNCPSSKKTLLSSRAECCTGLNWLRAKHMHMYEAGHKYVYDARQA